MGRIVVEREIAAPPASVHAFLQDIDRYPEWVTFTSAVVSVERKPGVVGTVYVEKGIGGTSTWTIIEYVEGKREVHEGDLGIASARIVMTLEAKGTGTQYRHEVSYKLKVPVLGWVIDKIAFGRIFRRGMQKTVDNMVELIATDLSA